MSFDREIFLFGAALLAGALNSVAGGGSFISFPALLFTGIAPIPANATSTAALWPGTVASAGAYRREVFGDTSGILPPLVVTSLIGGLVGARLLLGTPSVTFMRLVPWLLLLGTLLFASSGRISAWIRGRSGRPGGSRLLRLVVGPILGLLLAVYIGYFGAGVGVPLMALLAMLGVENIHSLNGMRTLLVSVANSVALATFIWAKAIVWPPALLMIVGSSLGGYGGAFFARKMNPQHVRRFVIFVGFGMSLYFFIRH